MAFDWTDLAFNITIDDQEAEIVVVEGGKKILAKGVVGTCGPTNQKGACFVEWKVDFVDEDQFKRVREQLRQIVDQMDQIK